VETLSTEANPMRTAARYKVNPSKTTAEVTAQLSGKRRAKGRERRNSEGARIRRRSSQHSTRSSVRRYTPIGEPLPMF